MGQEARSAACDAAHAVTAGLDAVADDRTLAARLRISVEAVQLTRAAEVVDMHVDTFILPRISRYDVLARHRGGPFGRRFVGHLDVPRLRDGGLDGAMWSITTNPFRPAQSRWPVALHSRARFRTPLPRSLRSPRAPRLTRATPRCLGGIRHYPTSSARQC